MTLPLRPSSVLGGRYRLIEKIAVGGQGQIWRAEDTALGRQVAVKVLRTEFAGHPDFCARFRREAHLSGGLSHPGVARVFDFDEGQNDAPPYLVMEFVDGEPLSALIAREAPLPPGRALDIIASAAAGLAAAHAAGLVHRDVKPGNLLVCRDGSIKITDFGIAWAEDAVPLTRTGILLGTPLYLSPEQAAGEHATPASDLYALGIIAFQLLTGRTPYEGPAVAVLAAHRETPLPVLPASVPPAVRDLVHALTAKDPALRPNGATAVVQWVTRIRRAAPRAPSPAGPPDSRAPGGPGAPGKPADRTAAGATGASGAAGPPGPPTGPAGRAGPPSPAMRPAMRASPASRAPDVRRVPAASGIPGQRRQNPPRHAVPAPPAALERRTPSRYRRTLLLVAGGLTIAVVSGSAGWMASESASRGRPAEEREVRPEPTAPPFTDPTTSSTATSATITPTLTPGISTSQESPSEGGSIRSTPPAP